jgi:tol-pal system protein YbgF
MLPVARRALYRLHRLAFRPCLKSWPGVLAVAAAVSTLGCARSAEERQLEQMRSEIDRIQTDRDSADHEALRNEGVDTTPGPASSATPVDARRGAVSGDAGPPVEPDDEADTEDPTPRPTFRLMGGTPRAGRGGDSVTDDPSNPVTSALDPEAKRAYDAALALVTSKHCDKALDAFAAFLVKWPDHPYADNAMFWRGECFFQAGDYAHAAEQLEGALARFPAGAKAPDALLKLGMAQAKLGNDAKAKECFDRLLQLFPQSDAARRVPASATRAPASPPRGAGPEDPR